MDADLEKRARELLAAEYEKRGGWFAARCLVNGNKDQWGDEAAIAAITVALSAGQADARRLDYIERTFSGMTNRERYLPVQMIWGKGCNGRTLREACDKYMKRDAAIAASRERDE